MVYPTPEYLFRCFDRGRHITDAAGRLGNINLSSIATHIIQQAGRFAEDYASDMLIDWDTVRRLTSPHEVIPDEDSIVIFGIRRSGVDCTGFLMNRLQDTIHGPMSNYVYADKVYRKILAVRVSVPFGQQPGWDSQPMCTVTLHDITDSMCPMEQKDRNWNPDDWCIEYKEKHPGYDPLG